MLLSRKNHHLPFVFSQSLLPYFVLTLNAVKTPWWCFLKFYFRKWNKKSLVWAGSPELMNILTLMTKTLTAEVLYLHPLQQNAKYLYTVQKINPTVFSFLYRVNKKPIEILALRQKVKTHAGCVKALQTMVLLPVSCERWVAVHFAANVWLESWKCIRPMHYAYC